ncbi:MAG: hypothetical protein V1492_06330 [Candidatus Micrarchaeota archaeon]
MSGYTTILVHKETRERLANLREYGKESYEEVINKLITIYEKLHEEGKLTDATKKEIETARQQIKEGKGINTKKLMEELGL